MIYETKGYVFEETPKSNDQGADVLLRRGGEKTVIQAKLYSDSVGNNAVQEAIGARGHFRCHHAAVLTNNRFTASAQDLARTNQVELIDREKLAALISEFNRADKDYDRLADLLHATKEQPTELPPFDTAQPEFDEENCDP